MTHAIDASFRIKKQALAAGRRRKRWHQTFAAFGVMALAAAGAGFYWTADYWSFSDADEELNAIEASDDVPTDAPVYVPAIVDLAGDPMWISLAQGSGNSSKVRTIPKPDNLSQTGISPQIQILSDTMLSASERFMTTIPSTQEDFAFFQAQRASAVPLDDAPMEGDGGEEAAPALPPASPEPAAEGDAVVTPVSDTSGDVTDEGAGWGETISSGEAELPAFKKTAVENNTTVAVVTPELQRFTATEDFFVKILTKRSLESVVQENGFSPEDAKLADEALRSVFRRDALEPGYVVALRGLRAKSDVPAMTLMQVSIYTNNTFIGTLARNKAGALVLGADPWVSDDLFHYSGEPASGGPKRQYRLLDAIYSTAARNSVPTGVIGEAIMYLSRGEDLNAFATESDRFILIYSDTARGKDGVSGRVLYAGVQGAEKTLECFVFAAGDNEFACVTGNDVVRSVTVANGMVTPVNGVMTSTFGPRKHPILKTVRVHKGVDWAAPIGTPIMAAFDGQIVFQGNGGDYGNLVRISHADGRETRYAHMQRFAKQNAVGTAVKAGEVIGYIGTTGLSTGPHLHFELYQGGQAIDPLGTAPVVAAVAEAAPPDTGDSDASAVEKLTDRIIHVESGGKARAKNPLSTATGLGQFIESTWIRMMRTYRPDLANSLSRADLLELRYDPTISREMVANLAREGEAYLRARGHRITAGRLYLCHFLGMEGAHIVLSAAEGALIVDVMGAGVIRANPFLTGKTIGYVKTWAENKMNGRARRVVVAPSSTAPAAPPVTREVRQTSPEFEQYKAAIISVAKTAQAAL